MNRRADITADSLLSAVIERAKAATLERAFGYRTVRDLLQHYPRRYSKHGELTKITELPVGENVTLIGRVLSAQIHDMKRRKGSLLHVLIADDDNETIQLTYFNQRWKLKEFRPGIRGQFAGKVTRYRGVLQLQNPEYRLFSESSDEPGQASHTSPGFAMPTEPIPVYQATAQMKSWDIAELIGEVLDAVAPIADPHPEWLGLMPLQEALERVHRPKKVSQVDAAKDALRAREAFDLQLALLARRQQLRSETAVPRPAEGELLERFDASLPFAFTDDQLRAGETLSAELSRDYPMNRLLQGEVGSGKTVVALRAMLQVAQSGGQSALLAPTEVLASQHLQSIEELLGPELCEQLKPTLITGRMTTKQRRRALLDTAAGVAKIIVGTHALMSKDTTFYDLGLTVIDEQHRFGVEQREALRQKSTETPHLLAMTATPIPRTVALTVFGDLELLTIRQLPAGRQGIDTFVIQVHEDRGLEQLSWKRAREEITAGRGVYVVCPAIDVDQDPELTRGRATVEGVAEQLRRRPEYRDVTVAEMTGTTPSEEKEAVMSGFASGEIDVLVSTTVIEVGVNVPRATMMIVLEADRFGVSQLHQLRGRVGRGSLPGLCLLQTAAPKDSDAWRRLEAVAATTDGFALAEIDLELRREGDILGTRQSGGRSTLKLLRVIDDRELIEQARQFAQEALDRGLTPQLQAIVDRQEENLQNLAKT